VTDATPPLHPDLVALGPLLGAWRGNGSGSYPTVAPFGYTEHLYFGHDGRPFLTYDQRTRSLDDDRPLHAETGYLRPAGPGRAELVVAQPTGVVEVDDGDVQMSDGVLRLVLRSRVVGLTTSATEITAVERTVLLDGDVLHTTLAMAAVGQPLTHHLASELRRTG
jgi:hypothetical protein